MRFNNGNVFQFSCETLNDSTSNIHVGNLSPTKNKRYLGLISLFKKTPDMLNLKHQVMIIGLGTQLNLLDLNMYLFLSGFLQLLALLILELAIVHNAANGWHRRGRHLNEIQLLLFRQFKCLGCWNDAELFAVRANYSNFRRADCVINVYGRFCYGYTSWVKTQTLVASYTRLLELFCFCFNECDEISRLHDVEILAVTVAWCNRAKLHFLIANYKHVGYFLKLGFANFET